MRVQVTESWDNWHICFHGTKVDSVKSILSTGQLAKPGDKVLGGSIIGVREGHYRAKFERINEYTGKKEMFDPKAIFFSPSIKYSGLPLYSPTVRYAWFVVVCCCALCACVTFVFVGCSELCVQLRDWRCCIQGASGVSASHSAGLLSNRATNGAR